MKLILTIAVFFSTLLYTHGQSFFRWERDNRISLISGIGLNNYYGDLNESHKFNIENYNISFGIQYPLTATINLRGEAMYYVIQASDKNAPSIGGRRERNLSFRGRNFEFALTGVFNLFPEYVTWKDYRKYNLYLLAGVGLTYFSPETYYEGRWYSLPPLQTEGETYSQVATIFPVGTGLKYSINRNMAVSMECTYRFTTTDYLDDVSNNYIPRDELGDPVAITLADRGPEVGAAPREAGTPRGNPALDDGYIVINIKFAYKVGNRKPLKRLRGDYKY